MSKCEEDVLRIAKKLDKLVKSKEQEQSLELLTTLNSLPITLDVLQKTRIGMTVNAIRKSSKDEEVIALSKALIKNWKRLLSAGNKGEGDKKGDNSPNSNGGASNKKTPSSPPSTKNSAGSSSFRQTDFPSDTNNTVRIKCRELLSDALKKGEMPDNFKDPEELGAMIEDSIWNEFKDTNMKYKNRVRSRVSNLKDAKNPNLRINVLMGTITAQRIASMTAEDMASEDMKKQRDVYTKEAILDHQMAVTGGTKSSLLKCGKCKKSNCTYNQVQTRSSDEPMTTFVLCNECGNRWKFC